VQRTRAGAPDDRDGDKTNGVRPAAGPDAALTIRCVAEMLGATDVAPGRSVHLIGSR